MERDKVLLMTGASSDMGSALIRRIGKNYKCIWAHYFRSKSVLEELRDTGVRIIPIQADFMDIKSVENMIHMIEESGKMPTHIVHFSAPAAYNRKFHKCTWEDFGEGIDTSLRSIVKLLRAFIPDMQKKRYGKIVFMLTSYVLGVPPKFQSPYITVKYAQYGLMRSLAAEYSGKGITVNAVSPDMIETKFLRDIPDLVRQQNAENSPLKRNLVVDDVVPAFEYLLSDAADAVSGQNIGVTGGGEIAR